MEKESPWEQISDICGSRALTLLKSETTSTADTVEVVKKLVETAILARRIDGEPPIRLGTIIHSEGA